MFREKSISTGRVYYSDLLTDLEHFFTTRETVIRSNEDGQDTTNNIKAVCEYLNIAEENLISPTQTHSTNVCYAHEGKTDYPDTDGLILTNFDQAVYLNFADCTPIILYDKMNNIGAVVHAGWRGTVGRIAPKAIELMQNNSGTQISSLYCVIGPAIGQCCYKVGDEVIEGIRSSVKNSDGLITKDGYADLKATNARQLIEMGIEKEMIDICPYCTSCRNDLFFSYRKESGTTSRHSAVIKLKRK